MKRGADDDIAAPEVVRWWNAASVEERCFFMGRAGSLNPTKAFAAYQRTIALADEVLAAERTHQEVTARAAALAAIRRLGSNGAGTQH